MKNQSLTTLAATSLLLTSGFVSAADLDDSVDHQGIYVGAGYGLLKVDGEEDFDDEDNAVNVFVGGQINQIFSVEAGYIDFGRYGSDNFNTEVDGYTLAVKAGIPITNYLTVYAKGGQLWWNADLSATDEKQDVDGDELFYGLGASMALSEGWDLRLEYTRFDLEFERDEIGILSNVDDFDSEIDYVSLGVQYTF